MATPIPYNSSYVMPQNPPLLGPCGENALFPACDVVGMDACDSYTCYRVPQPPAVPEWTAWVESQTDNANFPWVNVPPSNTSNDGGATPGAHFGNAASEVYTCPKGYWALTYDDGPVLTNQTLALLAQANLKATFFLIGSNVVNNATHASYVQAIHNAGHQIALHTWTHRQISLQASDSQDISVHHVSCHDDSAIDDRIRNIIHSMGLRPVVWNIESQDAGIDPAAPESGLGALAGQTLTVDTVTQHVETSVQQGFDPRWNYFTPGTGTTTQGYGNTYNGFVTLEHDITPSDISVAANVIAWYPQSGMTSAYVNQCDQITPNASFYLESTHPLVQFIKTIKLPLTPADLAAFNGTFPTGTTNGSSPSGTSASTTSKSIATQLVAGVLGIVAVFLML
ncbi:chitin deacetylase [Physocladia obscura]|uniref:Chitin deacetylase n=1 Tax=Physocladia obscura TaxID=109957 RepID=A0AAD5SVI8_9FUNG|nr:chitin deacetylase [Physocladia obscura]